jgi:hypothetical protein
MLQVARSGLSWWSSRIELIVFWLLLRKQSGDLGCATPPSEYMAMSADCA